MKWRRLVKEVFLSLETIETLRQLSAFERGMVVGARCTGLCQELPLCWAFHTQQFPVCIKNGPPPKGHPDNLAQLWEALVNILYTQCNINYKVKTGSEFFQIY